MTDRETNGVEVRDELDEELPQESCRPSGTSSELHETPTGRASRVWKHTPRGGAVEVQLEVEADDDSIQDPEQEGVMLRARVRHRADRRIVDFDLVNDQRAPLVRPTPRGCTRCR